MPKEEKDASLPSTPATFVSEAGARPLKAGTQTEHPPQDLEFHRVEAKRRRNATLRTVEDVVEVLDQGTL